MPIVGRIYQKRNLAGKNLKPYQGLKQRSVQISNLLHSAGKNLKPYQGLKQNLQMNDFLTIQAGKNLKPYQGLKHSGFITMLGLTMPEKT